ncbi:ATP cone domain-containing protein [Pontibacter mucosus]|uniref:ATP cone domain-containing protein n=2 Tax=Pontibacter mucosus TaxID=1649266 RepID=A0A2T5Y9U2_9BACT|nr:ATP cone domain-containing protein [Pontibacter mucosus]
MYIRKASGEEVPFSETKLRKSLVKAGADAKLAKEIVHQIEKNLVPGITTQRIYEDALALLTNSSRPTAGKYKLKTAIMELGPSGFPFEKFVGAILKAQGFEVQVGQIVQGYCVSHEVDVIALKGDQHYMVECKFHNRPGYRCDVKIPLYIQSRFKDVEQQWLKLPGHSFKFHQGWVITNTRFTSDAIQYGTCAGLHLVGWNYPPKQSLNEMIDAAGLYPITSLTTLTRLEKEQLLQSGIVLCQELCEDEVPLSKLGISAERIHVIQKEGLELCHNPAFPNI